MYVLFPKKTSISRSANALIKLGNISLDRNGRSRVWRDARRRHAGLRTPSRRRRPTKERSFRAPREPVRRSPMGYPRSLPRENYLRFAAEWIHDGVGAKGEAPRAQRVRISERRLPGASKSENVPIVLKEERKEPYFHPLRLALPGALLSPSLNHGRSRITPTILQSDIKDRTSIPCE